MEHHRLLGMGVAAWNELRGRIPDMEPEIVQADFSGADLRGVNLGAVQYDPESERYVTLRWDRPVTPPRRLSMTKAFLNRPPRKIMAVLDRTDFTAADLTGANLTEACLSGTVFRNARLDEVEAADTDFSIAEITGATFRSAKLPRADFEGCDLSGMDFTGAHLEGASLGDARLRRCRLAGAVLRNADLRDADLTGADLTGADLSGAFLEDAVLTDALTEGANFTGADRTGDRLPNGCTPAARPKTQPSA